MAKESYQETKEIVFELMEFSYEVSKDRMVGAFNCALSDNDYSDNAYEEYLYYIAGLLFEIEHNDVEDEAEASGTYVIYKYDKDPEFRKALLDSVYDPDALEADIAKIKSMRELYYGGFEASGV